ncbi:MAG: HEAT repeat domain-containing protein [Fibromonadales bacterium]|nr:HEAT repeat domain-containing protein [Fibromonadales bacterium]
MFFARLKLFFLFFALAQGFAFALSDGSDFLVVPSAEVLGDKAFQVRGTIGYHQSSCVSNYMCDRHPFVSSLRFGLLNSLELGLQFGSTISLDVKDRVNKAFLVVPAIAIGARAFVESPEAYFYSVPKTERKEQTGEFYAVAEWGNDWWKLLGGVSVFPFMRADDIAPFWGFEQGLGTQKLSITYEGFFRYGFSHHNAGLSLKPIKYLQISAGASDFYRYFFNKDEHFGFRIKNPGAYNGYRAPGVYMSIAINGGFSENIQSRKHEIDSLKKQLAVQNMDLINLRAKLDNLEMLYYFEIDPNTSGDYMVDMQKYFKEIVAGYRADEFNPDSLQAKEQIFIERGEVAKRFLIREAKNRILAADNRIAAIRIMSHFPDQIFLEPLGSIVADNSNESISREAVLALGTINTPEARKVLATVANQTTGIVRETIIEILGAL